MKRKQKETGGVAAVCQLRTGNTHPFGVMKGFTPLGAGEERIYREMREAIPVLDAAVAKMVRLCGGFEVRCRDREAQHRLNGFLQMMPCGRGQMGIESFLSGYLDSLLTYGRAVGELVVVGGKLRAVCWGDVTALEAQEGENPLETVLWGTDEHGLLRPLPYQQLLLFTTMNPEPAHPYGVSMFRGMPFLADILLKIYNTIGVNWERAGNIRYSVICKGGENLDPVTAQERGKAVAAEWSRAMEDNKNGTVRDFVAVGDVEIKVIGGEAPILDSETPVRQILEQLVAKTGLPPFLLGLNWSTTERMSTQQADLLTSELWALRRTVEPAMRKNLSDLSCAGRAGQPGGDRVGRHQPCRISRRRRRRRFTGRRRKSVWRMRPKMKILEWRNRHGNQQGGTGRKQRRAYGGTAGSHQQSG